MALSSSPDEPRHVAVEAEGIVVQFDGPPALQLNSLQIQSGERVFVLGRSGSGKTTFARLIKGRLRPNAGRIYVFGKDSTTLYRPRDRQRYQRRVAMIDQEFFLVPRMNVINNILCGALGRVGSIKSVLGIYSQHEWELAESILQEVELDGLAERRIETLSGGQRQRVAIARALMQRADLILADEPISNLDPELAEDSLDLLVGLTERHNITLIMNLHQPRLAKRYATRVIGLRDGHIVFDGPPDNLSTESEELIYSGPS